MASWTTSFSRCGDCCSTSLSVINSCNGCAASSTLVLILDSQAEMTYKLHDGLMQCWHLMLLTCSVLLTCVLIRPMQHGTCIGGHLTRSKAAFFEVRMYVAAYIETRHRIVASMHRWD